MAETGDKDEKHRREHDLDPPDRDRRGSLPEWRAVIASPLARQVALTVFIAILAVGGLVYMAMLGRLHGHLLNTEIKLVEQQVIGAIRAAAANTPVMTAAELGQVLDRAHLIDIALWLEPAEGSALPITVAPPDPMPHPAGEDALAALSERSVVSRLPFASINLGGDEIAPALQTATLAFAVDLTTLRKNLITATFGFGALVALVALITAIVTMAALGRSTLGPLIRLVNRIERGWGQVGGQRRLRADRPRDRNELVAVEQAFEDLLRRIGREVSNLRTVLEGLDQGLIVTDASGGVLATNPKLLDLLRLPEEVVAEGRPLEDLAHWMDRNGFTTRGEDEDLLGTGTSAQHDITTPEGRVLSTVALRLEDGRTLRTFDDVTVGRLAAAALSKEKAFLEQLLDAMPIPVTAKSASGRYVAVNRAFSNMLGYDLASVQGNQLEEIIPASAAAPYLRADRRLLETGRIQVFEALAIGRGRSRSCLVSKALIPGDEPTIVTAFFDITETKQTEAALRAAKEAAERADTAKGAFLAATTHELRTPLNGIQGVLELLADTQLQADQRSLITIMRDSGTALARRIDEILDFSKIEAKALVLTREPFDPSAVVEDCALLMQGAAQAKSLELVLDIDPYLPESALGDAERLGQVINNLVSNAIKFTETGSVTISADLIGSESWRLVISDTGIGFPQEDANRLFEPFRQADERTARRFGGTGLGLSISRSLVQLMRGSMSVESRPGVGTVFTIHLPLEVLRLRQADQPLEGDVVAIAGLSAVQTRAVSRWLEAAGAVPMPWDDGSVGGRAALLVQGLTPDEAPPVDLADVPMIGVAAPGGGAARRLSARRTIAELLPRPVTRQALLTAVARALGREVRTDADAATQQKSAEPPPAYQLSNAMAPILIVDDNEINRTVLAAQLERLGFRCVSVDGGSDALSRIDHGPIPLVVTDLLMPKMDGFTLMTYLRRHPDPQVAGVPIIALTANATAEIRDEARAAGANAVLEKPAPLAQLEREITRLVPDLAERRIRVSLTSGSADGDETVRSSEDNPLLDMSFLEEVFGDPQTIGDMLDLFKESVAEHLSTMETASEGDRMADAAHALGGAAKNAGALALARACRRLEINAGAIGPAAVTPETLSLLRGLRQSARATLQEIEQYRIGL